MAICWEVVIYQVEPGQERRFDALHPQVLSAMRAMPGCVDAFAATSVALSASVAAPLRLDRIAWVDSEAARAGYTAFAKLEIAKSFMQTISRVVFSGHFEEDVPPSTF